MVKQFSHTLFILIGTELFKYVILLTLCGMNSIVELFTSFSSFYLYLCIFFSTILSQSVSLLIILI